MTPELAAIFVRSWNIYQKIITYNYMRHKEMAEKAHAAFASLNIHTPLRVLDFGCGDAQPVVPLMQLKPVAEYAGYDLSEAALEAARQNLSALHCMFRLNCAPMQSFVYNETGNFDVIHSSYAIHHLQNDEKKILLQNCFDRLGNGGRMIVADIFSNTGQSREDYVEAYISNIQATWHNITQDEKQQVFDHMRNYDFPVSAADMLHWAQTTGFNVTEHRIDERHTMLELIKQ